MKRLEELGISPAPWKDKVWQSSDDRGHDIKDGHNNLIAKMFLMSGKERMANARLIAAAPDLYECLREAVDDKCEVCKSSWYGNCVTKDGSPCSQVKKWREALTKASGEDDESKMTDYIGKYQDDINMTMEERKRG